MEYREENKVQKKKHYKWGIRKQLVFFTTVLAIITYTRVHFLFTEFPVCERLYWSREKSLLPSSH